MSHKRGGLGKPRKMQPVPDRFKVITNKYTKKRKLFNKANYEEMRKEFSDIDWEEKFKDCKDNVNDQWEILKTVLKLLEDKYVPQKEV